MFLKNTLLKSALTIRERTPASMRVFLSGKKLGWNGEAEAKLLSRLVEPGSTVIDVGANIGNYSFMLANIVGSTGKVISVEPLAENARWLIRAAPQLRLPIEVHVTALSSQSGSARMQIPVFEGQRALGMGGIDVAAADSESLQVKVTTLDEISSNAILRISFVKIDTEGHERQVLEGGLVMLREHRPNLLIEIEQRHHKESIRGIFDYITRLGYIGLFLNSIGVLCSIETFDIQKHQIAPLQTPEGFHSPDYINNFIFIPVVDPSTSPSF